MAPTFDKEFWVRQGGGQAIQTGRNRVNIRGQVGSDGWGEGWDQHTRIYGYIDPKVPFRLIIKPVVGLSGRRNGVVMLTYRKESIGGTSFYNAVMTTTNWGFSVYPSDNLMKRGNYFSVPAYASPERIMVDLSKVAYPIDDTDLEEQPEIANDLGPDPDPELNFDPDPAPASALVTVPDSPVVDTSKDDTADMEAFMVETCRMADQGGWDLTMIGINQMRAIRSVRPGLEAVITTPKLGT